MYVLDTHTYIHTHTHTHIHTYVSTYILIIMNVKLKYFSECVDTINLSIST